MIGNRYRLKNRIERFPHFIIEAGAIGTVARIHDDAVWLRMHDTIDGCEEWANEVSWETELEFRDDCERIADPLRPIEFMHARIIEAFAAAMRAEENDPDSQASHDASTHAFNVAASYGWNWETHVPRLSSGELPASAWFLKATQPEILSGGLSRALKYCNGGVADSVIEDALNAAVAVVQKAIGCTDGGFAAIYFDSGDDAHERFAAIMTDYAKAERNNR